MSREADLDKKLKLILKIGGKKQLFHITGFCGEIEALQEAVDFLEKLGASSKEIKRMLSEGTKKADLGPYKTKQQALDQLAWLVIIQGKLNDIKERVCFLEEKGVDQDFLRKVITLAAEISFKIYKGRHWGKNLRSYVDFILNNIFIKEHH